METIATRVKAALSASPETQKSLAAKVGMQPDQMSRALSGKRGFAAGELADIADTLGQDLHYLITGEPDPHAIVLAARHTYNPDTAERTVPSEEADRAELEKIRLALIQAELAPAPELPTSVDALADKLGADFASNFIDRVEALGAMVIRTNDLGTDWSISLPGTPVIAVKATPNWFRQNWSIAHELGHLVLRHDGRTTNDEERAANAFAAELLLPRSLLDTVTWDSATAADVADFLWRYGVSTHALRNRLVNEGITTSTEATEALAMTTQALLRAHGSLNSDGSDPVSARMTACSQRHFPTKLIDAHQRRIAAGTLAPGTLAWMLGVDAEELAPEPPAPLSDAQLDALLA